MEALSPSFGASSRSQAEIRNRATEVRPSFTATAKPASAPATANAPSIALPLAFVLTGVATLLTGMVWLAFRPETLATYHYLAFAYLMLHRALATPITS